MVPGEIHWRHFGDNPNAVQEENFKFVTRPVRERRLSQSAPEGLDRRVADVRRRIFRCDLLSTPITSTSTCGATYAPGRSSSLVEKSILL